MRLGIPSDAERHAEAYYETQLKPSFFFLKDHGDSSGKSLLILTESTAEGRIRPLWLIHGELAQWLEQRNHNPLVPSSNLGFATTTFFTIKVYAT